MSDSYVNEQLHVSLIGETHACLCVQRRSLLVGPEPNRRARSSCQGPGEGSKISVVFHVRVLARVCPSGCVQGDFVRSPVRVESLAVSRVVQAACSWSHSAVRTGACVLLSRVHSDSLSRRRLLQRAAWCGPSDWASLARSGTAVSGFVSQ